MDSPALLKARQTTLQMMLKVVERPGGMMAFSYTCASRFRRCEADKQGEVMRSLRNVPNPLFR